MHLDTKQKILSIIIPTLNEELNIGNLVDFLFKSSPENSIEVIISDGHSTDGTVIKAKDAGALAVLCPETGRGYQMNFGARFAKGQVLYFVHADIYPPKSFYNDIFTSIKNGFELGRFKTKFQSKSSLLKLNAFFTRFDFAFCHGGDQTLFICRNLFEAINGFNSAMKIMEDYDLVKRARSRARYAIMDKSVLVSARKYETNSWLRVQLTHMKIIRMFKNGASQNEMIRKYNELISYRQTS